MDLKGFFLENVQPIEGIKYVASKRFKDENSNPIEWELQPISGQEDEELKKFCTKLERVPGKKNQFAPRLDHSKYILELVASCIKYPNLNNAELQDSYKVETAIALLTKMLLPGELDALEVKVTEINGFDIALDELVDTAKN